MPVPSPKVTMDYLNFRTAACEVNMVALTACLGKAKKILDTSGGLNSEKILELEKKRKTLKDMFVSWEVTWKETLSANNNDNLWEIWDSTKEAVDGALRDSEKFLNENSIPISGANAVPASVTSSTGRTNGSAAARPGKCPGRDPASAAAGPGRTRQAPRQRPGKCLSKTRHDPASVPAPPNKYPGKTRQLPRQRPGGYPGKALQ